MRGRKPKPTARQIAEGDPRKHGKGKLQERLDLEPKPARGLPACPLHLKGRARLAWEFWREELAAMKLDSRPDAMMLEGACVGYSRAVEADLILAEEGLVVEESIIDDSGNKVVLKVKNHPAIAISNLAWKQVRAFCSEFGLSPVARTRLKVERDDDVDDLAKLLSQPRRRESQTAGVPGVIQ